MGTNLVGLFNLSVMLKIFNRELCNILIRLFENGRFII
jgi:hypothetical protein